MNDFGGIGRVLIKRSIDAQKPQEGDYMEGGLLHCGKCRTRKQAAIDFNGDKVIVGIMCRCQREEYEAQEAEDKRRQRYFTVMQRVDWCDICGYAARDMCHARVLQYLQNWDEMLKTGTGLLLWGGVGTGKSTSAAYLVRSLRKRFVPAIMTNLAQFGDVRDKPPNFNGVDLLVLDDIGTERQTDFMQERAFEIVDSRTRKGKPTVFTTNMTLAEMNQWRDDKELPPPNSRAETNSSREARKIRNQRFYSRVLERSIPVKFAGIDHRQQHAADTLDGARKLFGV